MITIPIAVHTETFRWELSLLWHAHRRQYGLGEALRRVHAVIIKRNCPTQPLIHELEWDTSVPHTMCESFFDSGYMEYSAIAVPLNIQVGLTQVLDLFDDDQVIEVTDCDMFHFRPSPRMNIEPDSLVVSDVYESWHLKSLGENRYVVSPYFENDGRFYNGGFVPIIGRVRTFKRIMREWIAVHVDILRRPLGDALHWWAGMFALQAACEKARVQMIAYDGCLVPPANQLRDGHYIGHYSVDRMFDKRSYPAVDASKFPDDVYYRAIKDWLAAVAGSALCGRCRVQAAPRL